jgi:hypothetical protein
MDVRVPGQPVQSKLLADTVVQAVAERELTKKRKSLGHLARGFLWREKNDGPPWPMTTEEPWRDDRLTHRGGDLFHRLGLRPFGAPGHLKLDLVALIERLEA